MTKLKAPPCPNCGVESKLEVSSTIDVHSMVVTCPACKGAFEVKADTPDGTLRLVY